jgi:tRNA 5-methylaminomethyl-2-thiouridine biosynthesis bifunctional protein
MTTDHARALTPAALRWDGGQPFSTEYQDIYHAADGAAEVQRVFCTPNGLPGRFATRTSATFTIAELGFGSGLNFAVLAEQFLSSAPAEARLHYVSVELHPFSHNDFVRCVRSRSQALPVYRELERCYPPLLPGWHRRHLQGGRVVLTLFLGQADEALVDLERRQRRHVDAWLLDGFAPDRNPSMWEPSLLQRLGSLSAPGTTIATFTAAGRVRRSLEQAGFVMRRIGQLPHKRHTLAGDFAGAPSFPARNAPEHVTVIGAGLAGTATARQLADRGHPVTLFEAAPEPANATTTALHTRLSGSANDPAALWRAISYTYAVDWHRAMGGNAGTGILQFADGTDDGITPERLAAIDARYRPTGAWVRAVDPTEASALAGIPVREPALLFPEGRSVDLHAFCSRLRDHPRIRYRSSQPIALRRSGDDWQLCTPEGGAIPEAEGGGAIVLCTGSFALAEMPYLELRPVWGQLDLVSLDPRPAMPLIGEGLVNPALGLPLAPDAAAGTCAVGATYEYRPWDPQRATAMNLERLEKWWRRLTGSPPAIRPIGRWRGVRAVTPDRMPVVGPARDADGRALPRLWLCAGHGSSGTAAIPLAAEIVASEIGGEIAPASDPMLQVLSVWRFRARQLRRGGKASDVRPDVPGTPAR